MLKRYEDGYIGWCGLIDDVSGWGRAGQYVARNLVRAGFSVVPYQPFLYTIIHSSQLEPQFVSDISQNGRVGLHGEPLTEWALVHSLPRAMLHTTSPRKIMYTMWETEFLPDEREQRGFTHWGRDIMAGAEALIVPSSEQIPIFQRSGVDLPTYVVHCGIDTSRWTFRRQVRQPGQSRPFTFFAWSFMDTRKMPWETINCFLSAFGPNNPDVRLVLKTARSMFGDRNEIPDLPYSNVQIVDGYWTDGQLRDYLATDVDACVFLSHGEGFYMPPLEAMCAGIPTIVVDHTGSADYAAPAYCFPVRTLGMIDTGIWPGIRWWQPDLDDCIEQMRFLYRHYDSALSIADEGARWVKERWSLDHQYHDLTQTLESICGGPVPAGMLETA